MIAPMNDESSEGRDGVKRQGESTGEGRRLFAEDATERFVFNAEASAVDPNRWAREGVE